MSLIVADKHDFADVKTSWAFDTLSKLYGPELAAQQLQLEHEAHVLGEERFARQFAKQQEREEMAETSVAKPLIHLLVPKFSAELSEWIEYQNSHVRRKHVALHCFHQVQPDRVAVITLKTVMNGVSRQGQNTLQGLCGKIGKRVEEEARFGRIRDEEAKHFEKHIRDALNKRNGHTYKRTFMEAVEAKMLEAGELNGAWHDWENDERDILYHIGLRCLEVLIKSTGLVEVKRENAGNIRSDVETVVLRSEWVDSLAKRAYSLAGMSPFDQPMVVPPRPWTRPTGGGYWGRGRRPTRFIRTYTKAALERYRDVDMPEVYKAVNIAQNTAWAVNPKTLEVATALLDWKRVPIKKWPLAETIELPHRPPGIDEDPAILKTWKKAASISYRGESARVSRRLALELTIETAKKFSEWEAIYFPYNLDWRGRVYALAGSFSPQGNDVTKGLLQASIAEPVGLEGIEWMMIHGANTFGVDKVPFNERKDWVRGHQAEILRYAEAPLEHTGWMEADSPFCFLAFCFEWAGVVKDGPAHRSALPIAFDGSCSGIQHFSAMLRDERGGRAVNLVPSESVQDIYKLVSDEVNLRLREDLDKGSQDSTETKADPDTGEITERRLLGTRTLANGWLSHGVDRSVTKRSVMTLAYGSKEYGFTDQVRDDIITPAVDAGSTLFPEPQSSARYMAKLIWDSVSRVVVAAVEAMNWLQKAAKLLAKEVVCKKTNETLKAAMPVYWVTTDGFPVWQEYKVSEKKRIDCMFLGTVRLQATVMMNPKANAKIDARKQESGISPNFVHSQDGSHLRKTVVHGHEAYGIEFFALIHDSFGTIPAHAGKLFRAVRETFVETYEDTCILSEFREQFIDQLHESQLDQMPPIPAKGSLNIRGTLQSNFAFA